RLRRYQSLDRRGEVEPRLHVGKIFAAKSSSLIGTPRTLIDRCNRRRAFLLVCFDRRSFVVLRPDSVALLELGARPLVDADRAHVHASIAVRMRCAAMAVRSASSLLIGRPAAASSAAIAAIKHSAC